MEIKGKMDQGVIRVTLAGRLDYQNAMTAEQAFLHYAESGSVFVLDFADVELVSSAGIRALLTLYRTVDEKGGSVTIEKAPGQVLDVLKETGFAELFHIR